MRNKYIFQEADFYGASKLVFGEERRPICYKASWMHGLGHIFANATDSKRLLHYNERNRPLHLVNNNDSVNVLEKDGLKGLAVGMPFIYSKPMSNHVTTCKDIKRLYMPPHSIPNYDFISQYKKWSSIIKKYKCDAICLGGIDYDNCNNNNIDFGDAKVMRGAVSFDDESLNNMAALLMRTKDVLTDSRGSHLVYAALAGANIRILNEIFENMSDENSELWQKQLACRFPKEVAESFIKSFPENRIKEFTSSVWFSGNDKEIKEYAEYVAGIEHKVSIEELKEHLSPDNIPQKLQLLTHLIFNKTRNKLGIR